MLLSILCDLCQVGLQCVDVAMQVEELVDDLYVATGGTDDEEDEDD